MKRFLLSALTLLSAFVLFADEEIPVNGNFQPDPRSKNSVPRFWWSQHNEWKKERDKVKFALSEEDGKGARILTVTTFPDFRKEEKSRWKNFCMYTTNIDALRTVKGDEFTVTAEIAGEGNVRFGFLGYGTAPVSKPVSVTEEFRKYSFDWKTKTVKGDASGKAYYRVFFEFSPGTTIKIKNVKVTKKSASGKDAERAGFRYYPVYKLAHEVADSVEKDLPNWKDIPEGKGFLINKLDKFQTIARQSSFKIAHRDGKLYVLVRCEEPYMDQVLADENNWRDGVSYRDDLLEFCISSKRGVNLVHSYNLVNSRGASKRSHAFKKIPGIHASGKDFWMVRISFDLDDLLINGEKMEFGKDYYFNVGRTNHTAGNRNIHSSISREFGQTTAFQILELVDKVPTPAEKREAEEAFNGRYASFLSGECYRISKLTPANWKKTYESFGRLNEALLEKAMRICEDAAKAKTFSERENIVRAFQKMDEVLRTAQKKALLLLARPTQVKKLILNGKELPVSDKVSLSLELGANILCAETVPGEKVSFMIEGHPETLKAWRTASKAPSSWRGRDYDDTSWTMAECDEKGEFASQGFARQILVWENVHYGAWRLFTKTRKWNFVSGGLNTLKMQLDSPTAFALKEMDLFVELPSAFHIFRQDMSKKGTPVHLRPVKVTQKPGSRKGFTRYEYSYKGAIKPVGGDSPAGSYLVFQADETLKPGTEFEMTYSRSSGNLVELFQKMPCKVLPKIDGRLLKYIYIETHPSEHRAAGHFSEVDLELLNMKDRLAAGINLQKREQYYELYKDKPITLAIRTCYPIWGSGWSVKKNFFNYVKEHKEAQARFFGGVVKWGGKAPASFPRYMDRRETTQVCPTWATTKGQEEYVRNVTADMKLMKERCPHAKLYYNNWEGYPATHAMGYCFCDNCKEAFRKYANLPANVVLTDEAIRDRYWKTWYEFRVKLDGKIAGLVKKAANSLGMKYFLYHQYAHPDYWKAAAGNIDVPYQGCPGSAPADSKSQHIMDSVAKYMWEYGYDFFMGQIFNPGWDWRFNVRKDSMNSYSGFFEPETTKPQIIRCVAVNRGGLSVWGDNFSGAYYYIGEATRALAAYEEIFVKGTRKDSLVRSQEIAYPNALVIVHKNARGKEERLVLLFNESEKERSVTVENLSLPEKYTAEIYEGKKDLRDVKKITLSLPPKDVVILCVRER